MKNLGSLGREVNRVAQTIPSDLNHLHYGIPDILDDVIRFVEASSKDLFYFQVSPTLKCDNN